MLNHVYFCGFLIFSSFSQIIHSDQFGWGWPTLYAGMNYPTYYGYHGNMAAASYPNMLAHPIQNMATNRAYNMVINPARRIAINTQNILTHAVGTTQQHHLPRTSAFVDNRPVQITRQKNHRHITGNRIHQINENTRHTIQAKVANIKSRIGVQNNGNSLSKHQTINHSKQHVLHEPVATSFVTVQDPSRVKLDHTDKNDLKVLSSINRATQNTDLSNMVSENNFAEAEKGQSSNDILRLLKDINPNVSYTGGGESALKRLLLKGQNGLLSLLTGSGNGSYSNVLLSWESLHAPNSSKEKNDRRHDRAHSIKQTIVFAKTANILSTVGSQHNDKSSTVMVNNGTINKVVENAKKENAKTQNLTDSATDRLQNLTDSATKRKQNLSETSTKRKRNLIKTATTKKFLIETAIKRKQNQTETATIDTTSDAFQTFKLLNRTSTKNKNSKHKKTILLDKVDQYLKEKPIAFKTVNNILKDKKLRTKPKTVGKLTSNNNNLTNRHNSNKKINNKIHKTKDKQKKYRKIKIRTFTKHKAQNRKNKGNNKNFLKNKQFIFLKNSKKKGSKRSQLKPKSTKRTQQANQVNKQSVKNIAQAAMGLLETNNIVNDSKIRKKSEHVAIPKLPMKAVEKIKIEKPSLAEFAIQSADHPRRVKINKGSRTSEIIRIQNNTKRKETESTMNLDIMTPSKTPGEIRLPNNVERKDKISRLTENEVIKILDSVFATPVTNGQTAAAEKAPSNTATTNENKILITEVSKMPETLKVKGITKNTEFKQNKINIKTKPIQTYSPEMQSVNSKFDSIDLSLRQKHPTQVSKEFLFAGPSVAKSENTEKGMKNVEPKPTFGDTSAAFSIGESTPVPTHLQTAVRKVWSSFTKLAKGREATITPQLKLIKKNYTTAMPMNDKGNMHDHSAWSDSKVINQQQNALATIESLHSTFHHPNSLHSAQNIETLFPKALQNKNKINTLDSAGEHNPLIGLHSQIDQLKAWIDSNKKSATQHSTDSPTALNPQNAQWDFQQIDIDFSRNLPKVAVEAPQQQIESIPDFTKPWIETTTVPTTSLRTQTAHNYNWSNLFPGSSTNTDVSKPVHAKTFVEVTPTFTDNNTGNQTVIISAKQIDVHKVAIPKRKMQTSDISTPTHGQSLSRKFENVYSSEVNQGKIIPVIKTFTNFSDLPKAIAERNNFDSKLQPENSNTRWITVTTPESGFLNIVNEGKWVINAVKKSRTRNVQNVNNNTSASPIVEKQKKTNSELTHNSIKGINVDTFLRAVPNIKSVSTLQDFNSISSQNEVRNFASIKDKNVGKTSDNVEMHANLKTVESSGSPQPYVRKTSTDKNLNDGIFNTTLIIANTRNGESGRENSHSHVFPNKETVSEIPQLLISESLNTSFKANVIPRGSPVNGINEKHRNQMGSTSLIHSKNIDSSVNPHTNKMYLNMNSNINDMTSKKTGNNSYIGSSGNRKHTHNKLNNNILFSRMKASNKFSLRNSENANAPSVRKFHKNTAIDTTRQGSRKPEVVKLGNGIIESHISFTKTKLKNLLSDINKQRNPSPMNGKQQADELNIINKLNSQSNDSTGKLRQRKILNKNFKQINLFSKKGSRSQTKTTPIKKDLSTLTKYPGFNTNKTRIPSQPHQSNRRTQNRNMNKVASHASITDKNSITNRVLKGGKASKTIILSTGMKPSLSSNMQSRNEILVGTPSAGRPQFITRRKNRTEDRNNQFSFGKNAKGKNTERKNSINVTNNRHHNRKIHNVVSSSSVKEILAVQLKQEKWVPVHPTAPEPHKGWVTLPVNNELLVRKENNALKQANVDSSTLWQQKVKNKQNVIGLDPRYQNYITNGFNAGFETAQQTGAERTLPWLQQEKPMSVETFESNADAKFPHSENFNISKSASNELKNSSFRNPSTEMVYRNLNNKRQAWVPMNGRWENSKINKGGRKASSQETLSMRGNNIQVVPRQQGWRSTWPFLLNNDFELDDIIEL